MVDARTYDHERDRRMNTLDTRCNRFIRPTLAMVMFATVSIGGAAFGAADEAQAAKLDAKAVASVEAGAVDGAAPNGTGEGPPSATEPPANPPDAGQPTATGDVSPPTDAVAAQLERPLEVQPSKPAAGGFNVSAPLPLWLAGSIGIAIFFLMAISVVVWRVWTSRSQVSNSGGKPLPHRTRPARRRPVPHSASAGQVSNRSDAGPRAREPKPGHYLQGAQPRARRVRRSPAPPVVPELQSRNRPPESYPRAPAEPLADELRFGERPTIDAPVRQPVGAPEAATPFAELHQSLEALSLMSTETGAPPSLHDLHAQLSITLVLFASEAARHRDEKVSEEADSVQHHLQFVEYFGELLQGLQTDGQCVYTDSFGDEVTLTTIEEWVNTFAVDVLDAFAERVSNLEQYLLQAGDAFLLEIAAGMYRRILKDAVPKILAPIGFGVVQTFPALSDGEQMAPDPSTMKVVGQRVTAGFTGCVVETKQVGLTKDRLMHRHAEVVTG